MSKKVPKPNTNADFDTSLHITKSTEKKMHKKTHQLGFFKPDERRRVKEPNM